MLLVDLRVRQSILFYASLYATNNINIYRWCDDSKLNQYIST